MLTVKPSSLAETLDAVDDALFFGQKLTGPERKKVARWITEQRGKPGAYAGMFAPTSADRASGIKLFTGEAVKSKAAIGHILGEEACRVLILLDVWRHHG